VFVGVSVGVFVGISGVLVGVSVGVFVGITGVLVGVSVGVFVGGTNVCEVRRTLGIARIVPPPTSGHPSNALQGIMPRDAIGRWQIPASSRAWAVVARAQSSGDQIESFHHPSARSAAPVNRALHQHSGRPELGTLIVRRWHNLLISAA